MENCWKAAGTLAVWAVVAVLCFMFNSFNVLIGQGAGFMVFLGLVALQSIWQAGSTEGTVGELQWRALSTLVIWAAIAGLCYMFASFKLLSGQGAGGMVFAGFVASWIVWAKPVPKKEKRVKT